MRSPGLWASLLGVSVNARVAADIAATDHGDHDLIFLAALANFEGAGSVRLADHLALVIKSSPCLVDLDVQHITGKHPTHGHPRIWVVALGKHDRGRASERIFSLGV